MYSTSFRSWKSILGIILICHLTLFSVLPNISRLSDVAIQHAAFRGGFWSGNACWLNCSAASAVTHPSCASCMTNRSTMTHCSGSVRRPSLVKAVKVSLAVDLCWDTSKSSKSCERLKGPAPCFWQLHGPVPLNLDTFVYIYNYIYIQVVTTCSLIANSDKSRSPIKHVIQPYHETSFLEHLWCFFPAVKSQAFHGFALDTSPKGFAKANSRCQSWRTGNDHPASKKLKSQMGEEYSNPARPTRCVAAVIITLITLFFVPVNQHKRSTQQSLQSNPWSYPTPIFMNIHDIVGHAIFLAIFASENTTASAWPKQLNCWAKRQTGLLWAVCSSWVGWTARTSSERPGNTPAIPTDAIDVSLFELGMISWWCSFPLEWTINMLYALAGRTILVCPF